MVACICVMGGRPGVQVPIVSVIARRDRPVKLDYFSPFSDLIVIRGLQADSGRGRHQVQ